MYEKILQKLKAERDKTSSKAVSDKSLEDMAKFYVPFFADETSLEKVDFSEVLRSYEGNISNVAAEAVKAANKKVAEEARKKAEEEARKKAEEEAKSQSQKSGDDVPEWAKTIMDTQKIIINQYQVQSQEKVFNTRKERLKKSLDKLPDFYTKPIFASFDKTTFEKDEDFDQYITEIESNTANFIQGAAENGMNRFIPDTSKTPKDTGETPLLSEAREVIKKSQADKQSK